MVDFQSRDTRRGVSDDDEAAEEADDSDEVEPDEQGETDDTAADEPIDESGSSGVDSLDDPASSEPSDDDAESSNAGITAADPNSAPADDPLSSGASTSDADSAPMDAAPSDTEPTTATEPAASSDIDRIGDEAETEPDSPEPAVTEPTDATTEPSDATSEPSDATSTTPSRTVGIALVTIGDPTQGGTPLDEALETAIESTGHEVVVSERAAGGYDGLQRVVDELVELPAVDVVVTAGGIGITSEERTIEAVHPLLEKALPGFGEAFRQLLYERIGTGIVAVRSTAGIADGTLVFSLPADAAAARLAIEEIVATEAPELVAHLDE